MQPVKLRAKSNASRRTRTKHKRIKKVSRKRLLHLPRWNEDLTDLSRYKLTKQELIQKQLSLVSKNRLRGKELVKDQKKKNALLREKERQEAESDALERLKRFRKTSPIFAEFSDLPTSRIVQPITTARPQTSDSSFSHSPASEIEENDEKHSQTTNDKTGQNEVIDIHEVLAAGGGVVEVGGDNNDDEKRLIIGDRKILDSKLNEIELQLERMENEMIGKSDSQMDCQIDDEKELSGKRDAFDEKTSAIAIATDAAEIRRSVTNQLEQIVALQREIDKLAVHNLDFKEKIATSAERITEKEQTSAAVVEADFSSSPDFPSLSTTLKSPEDEAGEPKQTTINQQSLDISPELEVRISRASEAYEKYMKNISKVTSLDCRNTDEMINRYCNNWTNAPFIVDSYGDSYGDMCMEVPSSFSSSWPPCCVTNDESNYNDCWQWIDCSHQTGGYSQRRSQSQRPFSHGQHLHQQQLPKRSFLRVSQPSLSFVDSENINDNHNHTIPSDDPSPRHIPPKPIKRQFNEPKLFHGIDQPEKAMFLSNLKDGGLKPSAARRRQVASYIRNRK